MFTIKPQVSHQKDKSDENYGKWAVIKEDPPECSGDVGFSSPDENLQFLNANMEWQDEPFVMETKEEADNHFAHYNKQHADEMKST